MTLAYRPITPDELSDFTVATERAFGGAARPQDVDRERLVFECDRSIAAFDGTEIVATASAYGLDLALPGRTAPVAGVTFVGVLPTHRRRGIATELMRRQLHGLHEAGREPVAALWASEAGIYGRFGYAVASNQLGLRIDRAGARLRDDPSCDAPALRLAAPADVRTQLCTVYDAVWASRPGYFARSEAWWSYRLADLEHHRNGWSPLFAVVATGEGGPEGYALYRAKPGWTHSLPDGEARVEEVVAATPRAHAAIWRCVLGLDLTTHFTATVAPDDPLLHLLVDRRRARPTLQDNLWVRLVDVDRALAARGYAAPVDLVLEVSDEFCPWNAGRWRLVADGASAHCERTDDSPDLTLTVDALAAAFLGGTSLHALALAGAVHEHSTGAVTAAATSLGWHRQPFCPMVF